MRALLVDDDRELAALLTDYLTPHGVTVVAVVSGEAAFDALAKLPAFDVVLLDVMLPGADGFAVCRRIRETLSVPIVMLTARGDDTDRIVGLELGADDYVPKPFNPRELLARMRAVLRRARPEPKPAKDSLEVGTLSIHVPSMHVTLDGKPVPLTGFEFRVLAVLARKAGETVTRDELSREVRGDEYDPAVDRSLDVHVSHLRQKLGPAELIRTVRGVGYVLVRPKG